MLTQIRNYCLFVLNNNSNNKESRKHIEQDKFIYNIYIYTNFKSKNKKRIYLYIIVVFTNLEIALFKNFKNNVLSKFNYFD